MKQKHAFRNYTIFSVSALILLPMVGQAANCHSAGNGNWTVPGIWSCGGQPNAGDEIVIDANTEVVVNSNLTYSGAPMKIKVYGVWRFDGGGAKITMPCGSSVVLGFGGQVIGNGSGNSQTIRICNNTYWSSSHGTANGPLAWPAHALPVELVSFNAQSNGLSVGLDWSTATEQNSDYFDVLRSRDADHWDVVATIPAAGQSTVLQQYAARDVLPHGGTWFYKLLQYDADGTLNEKGIIPVQVRGDRAELVCGPIPVVDEYMVARWSGGQAISVNMTDLTGRPTNALLVSNEEGRIRFDLSQAAPGMHVLMVETGIGERRSCRVVVQ